METFSENFRTRGSIFYKRFYFRGISKKIEMEIYLAEFVKVTVGNF